MNDLLFKYKGLTEAQQLNSEINRREAEAGLTDLISKPRRIVLELTNRCNLRCVMCGRGKEKITPMDLHFEDIKKLAPLFKTAEEVTLFGWGESTLHPHFNDIVSYLNKFPVKKYLLTNGTRLDSISDIYSLDILAVSMDGMPETNNEIRVGSDGLNIIKQLHNIVKNRHGRPWINFVMTLMKFNIDELPMMVKTASDIGIEEVKGVYLTAFTDNMAMEVLWGHNDLIKRNFDKARELGYKYGIKVTLPPVPGEAGPVNCHTAWSDLFVGADGYVRPCMHTTLKFHHISEKFENIWNSEEVQNHRRCVNSKNRPMDCQTCYQSNHADWNQEYSFIQINNDIVPKW